MANVSLKRFLPNQEKLQKSKWLKIFGKRLYEPNLWRFNRYSVAWGSSIGLLIAYLPLPGHMLVAALLAIIMRANLPIAILLVWIANPLTYVPMFGLAYTLGAKLLGLPLSQLKMESLFKFHDTLEPLLLGCLICGGTLALISNLLVRLVWRYNVAKNWQKRRLKRYSEAQQLTSTEET